MIAMTLQQAAINTKGLVAAKYNDIQFSDVATDTRKSMSESLFIALKGENFNAHDYLAKAEAEGAVACLLDEDRETALPVLKVENTQKAMGQLALSLRKKFSLPCIGITGSCGKTTVKEMVASILSCRGKVLATEGNFNNAIGVPLTLFRLTADDDFAVIEMGASQKGDIDEVAQLVLPEVALITNVSAAHLQGLGSIEGVAKVKGEILNYLQVSGTAILEHDSPWLNQWREQLTTSQKLQTFSNENQSATYHAKSITSNDLGQVSFLAQSPLGEIAIALPLAGLHNVSNALSAMAAAIAVGASLADCQKGLAELSAVKGRLEFVSGIAGSQLINDSYNANPASLKVALELLAELSGKRILVLGDMAELGDQAEQAHLEAGILAKKMKIDGLYATGKLTTFTVESYGEGAKHFNSRELLSAALKEDIIKASLEQRNEKEKTVWNLLIKGSRSAGMDKLVRDLQPQQQKETGNQPCY
ncbi:MAG: UDP-N-acetylmuramoyl-tripeptide--D-alanyl-D-alanine ligase [Enterobacterales bacterium]|jgi:UDP-N-acetylmuramoyl-tripeptide--D-alanyl-D-alanine ligase